MTTQPDPHEPCERLDWDSDFFGREIARASPHGWSAADWTRALAWCDARRIECLYLLVPSDDSAARRFAEDHGARLVDMRVTFELRALAEHGFGSAPSVRIAEPRDLDELRRLAAESHRDSRFFADPEFSRAACERLYATWIENSVAGWAQRVFTADVDGRVAGYVTCHLAKDAEGRANESGALGTIGLVAVAARARGMGLGTRLVEHALAWFEQQRCDRVRVVTQGANVAAQRLYQSLGFRTAAVELWYHRWRAP
ncbi:MAG: GNAT family N-acetyltransferase [Planctomycetes bacterium]|nr:GNAT family N-acetyltransferase [Planctomycetota bacterium]